MNRLIRTTLLGCLVAAATSLPTEAAGSGVAYIYDYDGLSSAYVLIRSHRRIEVEPFLPLRTGDRITVLKSRSKQYTMVLAVGGRFYVVRNATGVFCVGHVDGECGAPLEGNSDGAVATVLRNILASIARLFGQAQALYSTQSDQMVTRGSEGPPSIPILLTTPMAESVYSGELTIPWFGGEAPFRASLFSTASGYPVAEATIVPGVTPAMHNAVFSSTFLAVGAYRVVVEDAQHRVVTGALEIVAPGTVPDLSEAERAALSGADLTSEDHIIARSTLLAERGAQWLLEAYDELRSGPEDVRVSRVLQLRLAMGTQMP